MQPDYRLRAFLACARERSHPYYAAAAFVLARQCGDLAAMEEALRLGAATYRREGAVYARTGATVVQLTFFEETERPAA